MFWLQIISVSYIGPVGNKIAVVFSKLDDEVGGPDVKDDQLSA